MTPLYEDEQEFSNEGSSMAHSEMKKTGRPRIEEYDSVSKTCPKCGRRYFLREQSGQSLNRFLRRRFCSAVCAGQTHNLPIEERFLANVEQDGLDGCWNWTGVISPKGYGTISIKGATVRAHRLSYELHNGSIPDGLMVLHNCDNRRCVNPAHLRAGTNRENVRDAVERGRWTQGTVRVDPVDPRVYVGAVKDAARILGVSQQTIYRLRKLSNPKGRHGQPNKRVAFNQEGGECRTSLPGNTDA